MNDKFKLSKHDIIFALNYLEIPERLRNRLQEAFEGSALSEDEADELRDICTDKLDTSGFDIDYNPTEFGRRLERLIDDLFIDDK